MLNEMTMELKLERIDVCNLLLACLAAKERSNGAEKWDELHEKLKKQLKEFDKTQGF